MAQIITKPGMFLPAFTQVRGMATLKDIRLRLKSVKNIQKITQSMKMVSAAKYARAERELKPARSYGEGGKHFYEAAEVKGSDQKPHSVIIAMTSDRGLCGGVHSNVVKRIKALIAEHPNPDYYKVICVGDKSRNILQRLHAKNIMMVCSDYGKKPPTFEDARLLAQTVIQSEYEFDSGFVIYNKFRTVVSYRTSEIPIFHMDAITSSPKITVYDSIDADVLNSYQEFSLATLIYFTMKENACSEQSSRMSAMDSASKNAGEMIDKLTMKFNRTRQAVITRELIEIISGAAAL